MRSPNLVAALLLCLQLWSTGASAEDDEGAAPFVEILDSSGTVGAPPGGAQNRWTRVGVHLRVANRLAVPVDDLEVEVALVTARREAEVAIPGWRFRLTFSESPIPANGETDLYLEHQLPALRRSVPAPEILYRSKIVRYRLMRASVQLTARLLGSPSRSDQQAALHVFELDPTTEAHRAATEGLLISAAAILRAPPEPVEPSDALALLLALRAAGRLGRSHVVPLLLALPAKVDRQRWGELIVELADRMLAASDDLEPRMEALPLWARQPSRARAIRKDDAVQEVAQATLLRIGDRAVPALIRADGASDEPTRTLAALALHALGRSTVRSQLAIEDTKTLLEVISVLGEVGGTAPVGGLAELVSSRDPLVRTTAMRALERIGPAAVDPLLDALATPSPRTKAAITSVLAAIGEDARPALRAASKHYGVRVPARSATATIAAALIDHLAEAAQTRWTGELEHALELGRQGRYDEAFHRLDAVYAADPELYMAYAAPIAETYVRRAGALHADGNYDAAAHTLRVGLGIHDSPQARSLLATTQLALTRGYLELGQLDKATRALAIVEDGGDGDSQSRLLRAAILSKRAARAFDANDHGLARNLIEQARGLDPDDAELQRMYERLLIRENVVILAVMALLLPGTLLAIIVVVRQRLHRARMQRVESALDRQG